MKLQFTEEEKEGIRKFRTLLYSKPILPHITLVKGINNKRTYWAAETIHELIQEALNEKN